MTTSAWPTGSRDWASVMRPRRVAEGAPVAGGTPPGAWALAREGAATTSRLSTNRRALTKLFMLRGLRTEESRDPAYRPRDGRRRRQANHDNIPCRRSKVRTSFVRELWARREPDPALIPIGQPSPARHRILNPARWRSPAPPARVRRHEARFARTDAPRRRRHPPRRGRNRIGLRAAPRLDPSGPTRFQR